MLNEYLASAPPSDYMSGADYQKMHYGWTEKSRAGGDEPNANNFLDQGLTVLAATAPGYLPRPDAFACANYGETSGAGPIRLCHPYGSCSLPKHIHPSSSVAAADTAFPTILPWPSAGSVSGSWEAPGTCEQVGDLTLYSYPAGAHTEDKRVAYANPKYPHIESVHMFKAIKPTADKNGGRKE